MCMDSVPVRSWPSLLSATRVHRVYARSKLNTKSEENGTVISFLSNGIDPNKFGTGKEGGGKDRIAVALLRCLREINNL